MANRAAKVGSVEIRDAKALFEACDKSDDARFRYVVLAIGKEPLVPAKWAVQACIDERRRTERIAASRTPENDGVILDEIAVLVVEGDLEQSKSTTSPKHRSLRSMIKEAVERIDGGRNSPNDDALRTVRRAWEKEQRLLGVEGTEISGQKVTPRIERIKLKLFGAEYGTSKDPIVDGYWHYRKEIMRDPSMANTDMD